MELEEFEKVLTDDENAFVVLQKTSIFTDCLIRMIAMLSCSVCIIDFSTHHEKCKS